VGFTVIVGYSVVAGVPSLLKKTIYVMTGEKDFLKGNFVIKTFYGKR